MRIRMWVAFSLILILLLSGGCAGQSQASSSFDSQLGAIVQPYSFDFLVWEISTLASRINQRVFHAQSGEVLNSDTVVRYFSYVAQLNSMKSNLRMLQAEKAEGQIDQAEAELKKVEARVDEMKPDVEQTLGRQISEVLADQDIHNPFGNTGFGWNFPPVDFKLERSLNNLIISSRHKIQTIDSVILVPDMTTSQMEEVESSLSKLNVSALVVPLGGLGATYPTFVEDDADLHWTIEAAAHEWVHQYLSFKPLGFRYILHILGIAPNYEIAVIDETATNILGKEIGSLVYDRFYSQYQTGSNQNQGGSDTPVFDFNAAMRDIRLKVDSLLAQGQIEQAEQYMNEQQQYLAGHGYYIRKLNQAYFAFYGSYADNPTSVDPIGTDLQTLKSHSLSIKDFLDQAAGISSRQDLNDLLSR